MSQFTRPKLNLTANGIAPSDLGAPLLRTPWWHNKGKFLEGGSQLKNAKFDVKTKKSQ